MMRAGGRRRPGASALAAGAGGVLIFEALARLPRQISGAAGIFAAVWFAFALLTVGAHLWFALGADRTETGTIRRRGRQRARLSVTSLFADERRRRQRA